MEHQFKEILEGCRKNDKRSKEELIKRVTPLVLKVASLHYSSCSMKEDIMQQGFVIVLESARTYNPGRNIPYIGYLKRALYYGIYKAQKSREIPCLNNDISEGMELIDCIENTSPDVYETAAQNEEAARLHSAIAQLPEKQKKVITERFFKGLTLKEIAIKSGCKYITVVKLQERALKNLKEALKEGLF